MSSVFPQAAPSWTGCACDSSEDPQLVGNLLEQLSSSTEKFISCRQQLLRQQYHVPIIIGNPLAVLLGDSNTFLWQCLSGVLALLCSALLAQTLRSRAAYSKLQQHAKDREAEWRRAITSLHASLQDRMQQREQAWQQKQSEWQEKEAAWQQGVQEVAQLVQMREAALTDQSPATQQPSKVRSGRAELIMFHSSVWLGWAAQACACRETPVLKASHRLWLLLLLCGRALQASPAARGSDSASDAPASECVKVDQKRAWSPSKSPKDRDEPASGGASQQDDGAGMVRQPSDPTGAAWLKARGQKDGFVSQPPARHSAPCYCCSWAQRKHRLGPHTAPTVLM